MLGEAGSPLRASWALSEKRKQNAPACLWESQVTNRAGGLEGRDPAHLPTCGCAFGSKPVLSPSALAMHLQAPVHLGPRKARWGHCVGPGTSLGRCGSIVTLSLSCCLSFETSPNGKC